MSEQPETDPLGGDRRAFLKKMAVAGFAVPAVATFSTVGIEAAFAQTANASGTTTTTAASPTTTAASTTTAAPHHHHDHHRPAHHHDDHDHHHPRNPSVTSDGEPWARRRPGS